MDCLIGGSNESKLNFFGEGYFLTWLGLGWVGFRGARHPQNLTHLTSPVPLEDSGMVSTTWSSDGWSMEKKLSHLSNSGFDKPPPEQSDPSKTYI